jgi:hypothetical protein
MSISSIRHRTTAYENLHLKRNDNQHIHFICQAEVNIATEMRLQLRCATVYQVMPILIPIQTDQHIRTHILDYPSIRHRTTGYRHLCFEGNDDQHFHFISRAAVKIPTRSGSNSDTNTDSTTHNCDRKAAYRNQRRSSCDRNTTGLCVTFGGAADWMSRKLTPTAQSTTELRKHEWENGRLGGAQGMTKFGFCLLFVICLFFQWLGV